MSLPIILGLVVLGLVLYLIATYNQFQTLKTRIKSQPKNVLRAIRNTELKIKKFLKVIAVLTDGIR